MSAIKIALDGELLAVDTFFEISAASTLIGLALLGLIVFFTHISSRNRIIMAGLLSAVLLYCVYKYATYYASRINSKDKLSAITSVVYFHALTHDGNYPVDLHSFMDGLLERELKNKEGGSDYVYFFCPSRGNLNEEFSKPSIQEPFPLFYEKTTSLHDGRGVYVALSNGNVFWDENGTWITDYIKKHDNLKLTPLVTTLPTNQSAQDTPTKKTKPES